MYLTNEVYSRLQQAFNENGFSINVKSDYVVVENSEEQIEEKICKIVKSMGFCPLISNQKIENKFAFTISPYKIPEFFNINQIIAIIPSEINSSENHTEYLCFDEVLNLLADYKFASKEETGDIKDQWSQVNSQQFPLKKQTMEL